MSVPARDAARAELQEAGFSLWEAWALALQDCQARYPHAFGTVRDPQAWRATLDELSAKRDELFTRISSGYYPDDIQIQHVRDDGYALISFALSEGAVTLGPVDSAGERLVNFLLSKDPQKWGKEPPRETKRIKAAVSAPEALQG
jgi:hypothetical protein